MRSAIIGLSIIALILLIISLSTNVWSENVLYKYGPWKICPSIGPCYKTTNNTSIQYVKVYSLLSISFLVLFLLSFFMNISDKIKSMICLLSLLFGMATLVVWYKNIANSFQYENPGYSYYLFMGGIVLISIVFILSFNRR